MPAADARRLAGPALAEALGDSRATTLTRVMDLSEAQWQVPQQRGLNPVAWELGHIAWFAEFWVLRGPHELRDDGFVEAARAARIAGPDATFDSARLGHAARWQAAVPGREALLDRLEAQLDACLASLPVADDSDDASYMHRLALFHEDMHGEAFAWLRSALCLPAPAGLEAAAAVGDVGRLRIEGGAASIGRRHDAPGFSFDNEQPMTTAVLAPFEIDAQPLAAGSFLRFVEAGGYDDPAFWPGPAGLWRAARSHRHPERWRRADDGSWQARWFDRWLPLAADAALIHVNAWEAEAYCRWAKRRLPSAAEWECAAADPRFRWGGSVWEWTAGAFEPYPGFRAGPYRDYSLPWFGDHRELRGGSLATHARLHHPGYRNFFTPERTDVFAGFRTASSLL